MSFLSSLYKFGKFLLEYKVIIFIACIFLFISIYYYKRVIGPRFNKNYISNKEFIPKEETVTQKTATLYYFYTTWCPICKKATPEWTALQNETDGVVKNVNIIFKEIDCDKDTATADKFNIEGYPTIKLVYENKTYEYDAKPDKNTLIKFLNEVFNT